MILETFPVGPLRCNCTILGDEATHEAIVVDPGDNIPEILSRLQKHRLILRQIIVTHAHIDHVGGAALLKAATGAPVFLNQQDLASARRHGDAGGLARYRDTSSGTSRRQRRGRTHHRLWSRRRVKSFTRQDIPRGASVFCLRRSRAADCRRYAVCRIDRED